ncbi:MAG: Bax inhibitor-1/YccA family protein [Actinomycetaceae bacterium]|nr:Bax inhibitor-1/YccA family protein [Actinomycetaceae bacterium]
MSNPVFTSSPAFNNTTPAGYPTMPGYKPGTGTSQGYAGASQFPSANQYGQQPTGFEQGYPQDQGFNYPPSAISQERITYDDIVTKMAITFGVLLIAGAANWALMLSNAGIGTALTFLGLIGGLILGLVNSFKKQPSPALILAYSACEGLLLGGISAMFASMYDGVVGKAVMATAITFLVMLGLFKTGLVKNSPTLMRVLTIGMVSYLVFIVLNLVLSMTGVIDGSMRGMTIMGIPLGLIIGLLAVGLAAFSLVTDFDYAQRAVENGAPKELSWTVAFGFMVTLVWLYIEFLRIFAILSGRD